MKPSENEKPVNYDETIMNELLSQPEIRKQVLRMKAETLAFYKELLVSEGIYTKYVAERKKK